MTFRPPPVWCGLLIGVGGLLGVTGCSPNPRPAPVDAAKGREILVAALESWKRGGRADALQAAAPPVYVIDAEWQAGATLKDYRVTGDGTAMDASLYCPVTLTVRAGGRDVTKEVTYIVSTAPNRTVSRKPF